MECKTVLKIFVHKQDAAETVTSLLNGVPVLLSYTVFRDGHRGYRRYGSVTAN